MRRARFGSRGWTGGLASDSPVGRILAVVFYPLKIAVHLGLMGIAVASLAPLLPDTFPPLATLESFRLHMALAGCRSPSWRFAFVRVRWRCWASRLRLEHRHGLVLSAGAA